MFLGLGSEVKPLVVPQLFVYDPGQMLNLFPKLHVVSSPANLPLRAKGRRVRNSRPVLATRDHILTHPSSFKKERRKEAFLGNGVYLKPDKAHNCNLGTREAEAKES